MTEAAAEPAKKHIRLSFSQASLMCGDEAVRMRASQKLLVESGLRDAPYGAALDMADLWENLGDFLYRMAPFSKELMRKLNELEDDNPDKSRRPAQGDINDGSKD